MKKIILLGAACAALLASCSKNETIQEPKAAAGEIRFEIQTLSNTLQTRGDLLSQTPVNTVANVDVYVFDAAGDYVITIPITTWSTGQTSGYLAVASANYELTTTGAYTFVGVGTDASHEFTIPTTPTTLNAFTASVTAAGEISEIYAGQNTVTITAGEGAVVPLELTRKVAGILGYFTNVPAEVDGKQVTSIQLGASTGNLSVYLANTTMGTPFAILPYLILKIDLTGQTAVGGIYPGNFTETGLVSGVTQLANSQLKGVYAFPATGVTLTLALCGEGNATLKEWTIKDATSGATTFDLAANNLFSIGKKLNVSSTYGDGDTPGGGDDDTGVDLLNDREITIDISTDWSAINYLNLGPEI